LESGRAEQVLPEGIGTGEGGEVGKWWRRMNIMQILCTHICKWRNRIPIETIPGMVGGADGEEW
jgi:hypothetical protein